MEMTDKHDWRDDAACLTADPEIFFAEDDPFAVRTARTICGQCKPATKNACLQTALDNDETHGIFGGLTRRQRLHLTRKEHRA